MVGATDRIAPDDARRPARTTVVLIAGDDPAALEATRRSIATAIDGPYVVRDVVAGAGALASLRTAVAQAAGEVVMILRAGDVVLAGADEILDEALFGVAGADMVHAYWFPASPSDDTSRPALRRRLAASQGWRPAGEDPRRAIVVKRDFLQALPTFRRAALEAALHDGASGPERTGDGTPARLPDELDTVALDEILVVAAARILDSGGTVRLVPELLCARTDGGAVRATRRGDAWLPRLRSLRAEVRAGRARFLTQAPHHLGPLSIAGIAARLRPLPPGRARELRKLGVEWLGRTLRSIPGIGPHLDRPRPYEMLVSVLQRVPAAWLLPARRRRRKGQDEGPIAYVLARYPGHTDTFIRREVHALRQSGLAFEVFSLAPASPDTLVDPLVPAGPVHYPDAPDAASGPMAAWHYARRRPLAMLRLVLFLVRHRYRPDKTWWRDRDVLYAAVLLARRLEAARVRHVHTAWADRSALLALAASRLLGTSFSVQARASEIHRHEERNTVLDRIRFADFVITNSRYNEAWLRARLGDGLASRVHVIYNGVELARFQPAPRATRLDGRFHVLAVGRLVEPKGFRYLLEACRILRDRGVPFTCEVIGGPRDPDETICWLELRTLHDAYALDDVVRWRGAQPLFEVHAAYQRADCVVLPCVVSGDGSHDITPNVLIEAQAMGLPVVSTPTGAVPEIVDDGVSGLLVPPKDSVALADAIARLHADPALRHTLGAAGRRKAEEQFDLARNVQARLALFASLVSRSASSP